MKTAEEFLDKIMNNTFKLSTKNKLIKVMEEYAQYKVNELNKSDVIKSVCEKCGRPCDGCMIDEQIEKQEYSGI